MDELVGIVRGVLADGVLVIQEAKFLCDWLERNEPVRLHYFGNRLHKQLRQALEDGSLNAEEEDSLVNVLLQFIGGTPRTRDSGS